MFSSSRTITKIISSQFTCTNLLPIVFKYSEFVTDGCARVLQYCVGQNRKREQFKWLYTSFVTDTWAWPND